MSRHVVCVARGSDGIANAFPRLDESKVQLLYTKLPVGTGTFTRNKFIYIIFIGRNCNAVERGRGVAEINSFRNILQCPAGITVTEKSSLSLASLFREMRDVFVTDTGNFSIEKIQEDYKRSVLEQDICMYQNDPAPPPVGSQAADEEEEEEEECELPCFTSQQLNNVVCEIPENERRVLDALRAELGPLNWVTFEANPLRLTLVDAGNGGIFELVKRLPESKWLFGLFRMTCGGDEGRLTRLIFFQWIGSKLRSVRQGPTRRIFPKMASTLAPYQYEIYLVGAHDLKPQAIIDKCRLAFKEEDENAKLSEVTGKRLHHVKAGLRHVVTNDDLEITSNFTEERYNAILQEERLNMNLKFDFFCPKRKPKVRGNHNIVHSEAGVIYDADETLQLINQPEGGLIWGIFQAQKC